MNEGEVRVRMPFGACSDRSASPARALRAWILLVSAGLHGLAALALLAAGPLLAGPRETEPVPDHRVSARPTEAPPPPPIVPEEEPAPEWRHESIPDPEPENLAVETVEREFEFDEARGALRLPDPDGVIGIGTGRLRTGRLRPRRPLHPEPRVARTPARVVARSAMPFISLRDTEGAGTLRLTVKLGRDGRVTDVVTRRPSGVVSFDTAVRASVSHWRFEPATIDGEAVASEIDISLRPARAKSSARPSYPPRAIDLGLEGVVRLAAVVDKDGSVVEVKVLESSGKGLLDRAAIAALSRWTFHPARVNGHPTACIVEIRPIRFRLD